MKKIFLLLLFAGMFLLSGCPYESSDPIDTGSYKVPAWLIGNWRQGASKITNYRVASIKDNANAFTAYEVDSAGIVKTTYNPIIMSKLGKNIFLSVNDPEAGVSYYIYRLEISSENKIELLGLKEKIVPDDLEKLKSFLLANENSKDIYDPIESMTFRK